MNATLDRLAVLIVLISGLLGCAPSAAPVDVMAERLAKVKPGMTRAEVLAIAGKPAHRSEDVLPEQFSVGAPAPYDSPMLTEDKEYETWYFQTVTSNVKLWFSHPTAPRDEWVVIGSASTSRGNDEPL
ncbi:MAG: hypothetical protein H8E44_09915 [Planctomycetes bacterium]|nr:hypothetical protein [Planctomycetota bacterium]